MNRYRGQVTGLVVVAAITVLSIAALITGCEVGTRGTLRPIAPGVEHQLTNTITAVTNVAAQSLPWPAGTGVELIGGAVLSILAAWQALTHRAVNQLRANGGVPPKVKIE